MHMKSILLLLLLASEMVYGAPPKLTSVSPSSGTTAGGTVITLQGLRLSGATKISVRGVPCTSFSVETPTSATCVTPPGKAGTASVVVRTASGANASNKRFTYAVLPPVVKSVSPNSGTTAGGTSITITGDNLTGATSILVGGKACPSFSVISISSATCTTPPGAAGTASVVVTTSNGTSASNTLYTYTTTTPTPTPTPTPSGSPSVTAVSPTSGTVAGGDVITITGSNFTGASSILVGGKACTTFTVSSATTASCTTPAGTLGTASVVVTTSNGTSASNTLFTYKATGQSGKYYGPESYSTILSKTFTPQLTLTGGITTNRGRYLIADSPSATSASNYLSIGADYSATAGYTVTASSIASPSNYKSYFSALIQAVANSTDSSGYYRLDSHLNPNDSIDADINDSYKLKFRNNRGKTSPTYGYVVFSYDATSNYLRAMKRYTYSLSSSTETGGGGQSSTFYSGTYTEDLSFGATGYYVKASEGGYSLVSTSGAATKLYLFTSADNYGIPTSFNPAGTPYGSNPPAPFPSTVTPATVEATFSAKINSTYKDQVAASGTSAQTKASADSYLLTIPAKLASQGTNLRYSTDLYTAFRDAALAGKLASDAVADGVPGQNLVPFVYFTNEKDSEGLYHPFMNIVTYTNPGSPNGLLDIAGPPFKGPSGATAPVTKYSNLDNKVLQIPMKDYGQVTNVTDNAMNPASQGWRVNLVTDSGCGQSGSPIATCPAYDNYNYASTADMGVLIDGSIIFPVLNNTLMPSQWKGELSTYGCHVGQGGGGPHCHADGFKTGQSIVTLYNDSDYVGKTHPPLIGFGFDGVALFGVYRVGTDASMLGYGTSLDAFGGHNHDGIGYHYHAHTATMPSSYDVSDKGVTISASQNPVNVLLKGAWAGNINKVPYFGGPTGFQTNPYLGGSAQ